MKFCQIIIAILLLAGFLRILYTDFNGVKAREPAGFSGAIITLIVYALLALCYWHAGAFSTLLLS